MHPPAFPPQGLPPPGMPPAPPPPMPMRGPPRGQERSDQVRRAKFVRNDLTIDQLRCFTTKKYFATVFKKQNCTHNTDYKNAASISAWMSV